MGVNSTNFNYRTLIKYNVSASADCSLNGIRVYIDFGEPVWVVSYYGPDTSSFVTILRDPLITGISYGLYLIEVTDGVDTATYSVDFNC